MSAVPPTSWCGQSVERVEDAALLTGSGRFIDDLGVKSGTLYAAILRSPHANARVMAIHTQAARHALGVAAVLTGKDIAALSASLVVGVKAPIECWPIAVDRVRYVGEPVAVVVAANRYLAEDALDLVEVDYESLLAIVDPLVAIEPAQPILHDGLRSNVASERSFRYGDPECAFADTARRVSVTIRYPRNSCTPMETYGLVAEYDAGEDAYDVLANFMGPFSLHTVMARALKVPGNRFRLRTPPDSGGSFGVKHGVFPYIVLMGVASRACGCPVKWIEDRLEHLSASVSATNRVTTLQAAVDADGRVRALAWDQIEDVGAHIRAPEPATLYRMHGNLTGAYDIRHVSVRNRVVLTNKTPTGLNRGFGGPQVYYALERLMQRVAIELDLDPIEVIRKNLVPSGAFPYKTATGATLDSGDYAKAFETALADGGFAELRERQTQARAQGRIYGIGLTAAVEPSVSNMGYITTVLTPEERRKAGPKNGAQATATVALDPLGSVSVHVASVPQGQGHRTVLGQIVADALGLKPSDIRVVTELDTARDAWSIASGNYSSRFAAAVGGAAHLAALKIKAKLGKLAASQLNVGADEIEFAGGRARARGNPDNAVPFSRLAATSHWSPGLVAEENQALRETAFWTPPELTPPTENDEINSSLCHGFIFDFCGVEIDPTTGAVRIDKYVTMHDCGRILHPRHGGRADHRRLCACRRRGAVRGIRLRAGWQLPHRHFRRLSSADHYGSGEPGDPAYRDTLALYAARHQGRRRRQLYEHTGLHRQCSRGCARRGGDRPATVAGENRSASAWRGERTTAAAGASLRAAQGARPARQRTSARGGGARSGLGHAARPENAGSDHSRLPRSRKTFRHAFPRRCHARRWPGHRTLQGRHHALRTCASKGCDPHGRGRRRARRRARCRPHHACAHRGRQHAADLRIRRRD